MYSLNEEKINKTLKRKDKWFPKTWFYSSISAASTLKIYIHQILFLIQQIMGCEHQHQIVNSAINYVKGSKCVLGQANKELNQALNIHIRNHLV